MIISHDGEEFSHLKGKQNQRTRANRFEIDMTRAGMPADRGRRCRDASKLHEKEQRT